MKSENTKLTDSRRLHVFFSGYVQGIGFRFTAERLAGRLPVSGFVRNLPDGRVEIVAEGREADLENFLASIQRSDLGEYIRRVERKWEEPTGEFQNFGIRF